MRKSFLFALVLLWALSLLGLIGAVFGSVACAQAPAGETTKPQPLVFEGREGVWFENATAQKILVDLQALREQVRLYELQTARFRELSTIDSQLVARAAAQAQTALKGLKASEELLAACEDARRSWWRHPATWFAIGLITAAGFTGAGVALAH